MRIEPESCTKASWAPCTVNLFGAVTNGRVSPLVTASGRAAIALPARGAAAPRNAGAQRNEVLQAALARPLKLLVLGSTAGLLLGALATRVLAHIVYQANPRDPLVLGGVVVAMALVGLLATWIPAQRALSVDPLILLREE